MGAETIGNLGFGKRDDVYGFSRCFSGERCTWAAAAMRGCVTGGTPSEPIAVARNRKAASAASRGSCARHSRRGCVATVSSATPAPPQSEHWHCSLGIWRRIIFPAKDCSRCELL